MHYRHFQVFNEQYSCLLHKFCLFTHFFLPSPASSYHSASKQPSISYIFFIPLPATPTSPNETLEFQVF